MKIYEGKPVVPQNGKIAIVVARFNQTITQALLDGALGKLQECGVPEDQIAVAWVPGAFELPTLAQRFALDEDFVAVICLGCVIKGETTHDQHINRAVSTELARMGVENGIPIIFGVLTCENMAQALVRSSLEETSHDKVVSPKAGNKGAESAEAALEMINLLELLPALPEEGMSISESSLAQNSRSYGQGDFDAVEEFGDENEFDEFEEDDTRDPGWFLPGGNHGNRGKQSGGHGGGRYNDSSDRRRGDDRDKHHGDHSDRKKSFRNDTRPSGKSGGVHKSGGSHPRSEHSFKGKKGKK